MSRGYKITNQHGLYFLTFQVVDWIDLFSRKNYRDIIIDSLKYCIDNKGLQLFAYVIMTNHIHLIANCPEGNLSDVIRDFKKFTSKSFLDIALTVTESRRSWMLDRFRAHAASHKRNENFQIWTHENHPIELYSGKFVRQKLNYIHNNPVKAGIVENPEDYQYSSARNYAGLDAKIEVTLLF